MLLAAGLLDLQLYVVKPAGHSLGLKVLTYTYLDPVAFDEAQQAYIDSWKDDHNPLIQVIVGDQFWSDGTDLSELRVEEKLVTYFEAEVTGDDGETEDVVSVAVHDMRYDTKLAAILGIVTTLAICTVLAMGSLLLSKVTQDLVLGPIEEMITKVKEITANPIQAAQVAEEEAVKKQDQERRLAKAQGKKVTKKVEMETEVL